MAKEIAATKEATGSEAISLQARPTTRQWLCNALPVLKWLPAYQPKWLRADPIAGVTLAAYLMPAGLAPLFGPCFLAVLQFAAHSYHGHLRYLGAGGSIAW